jgi:hypothetical protein
MEIVRYVAVNGRVPSMVQKRWRLGPQELGVATPVGGILDVLPLQGRG